ncbi:hypothetical protein C3488_32095 [Streptomyces sp. Ru72]|nr:hypothetical protein C3488_32095 [Streptomyces sp. Ru72]
MTTRDQLRLLPWAGPDGKPCYLSTDDQGGYVSRLADHIGVRARALWRRLTTEWHGHVWLPWTAGVPRR